MSKRKKMSQNDYTEVTESRDWCKTNGYEGLVQWYGEYLTDGARRHSLPEGAAEARQEDDDDDSTRTR